MTKSLYFIGALCLAGVANAQVFTSNAAFQAAIGNDPGQYLNTFGSAAANWSGGSPLMSYTVSATGGLYSNGNFIGTNSPNVPFVFTFTSGNVKAIGGNFYSTDISDVFQPGVQLTMTYSDGFVDVYTPASTTTFRGYKSNQVLTSLTITSTGTQANRYTSLDNVITSTVPEPGTMAALGLGAVALLRRRNKKA